MDAAQFEPSLSRRTVASRVAWGAIVAGALIAVGALLLVGSFLAVIDIQRQGQSGLALQLAAILLGAAPIFFGGWTTVRLAAGETTGEALLHGAVFWSLTALVLLHLALSGIYVQGVDTIFGLSVDERLFELTTAAAWWTFAGILFSFAAAMLGAVAASPFASDWKLRRAQRRARHEVPERAPPAHAPATP